MKETPSSFMCFCVHNDDHIIIKYAKRQTHCLVLSVFSYSYSIYIIIIRMAVSATAYPIPIYYNRSVKLFCQRAHVQINCAAYRRIVNPQHWYQKGIFRRYRFHTDNSVFALYTGLF